MSCKQNDILADNAIDKVDALMRLNPSIPEEARDQLVKEEYIKSLEYSDDYEPQTYEEMEEADACWESMRKGEE